MLTVELGMLQCYLSIDAVCSRAAIDDHHLGIHTLRCSRSHALLADALLTILRSTDNMGPQTRSLADMTVGSLIYDNVVRKSVHESHYSMLRTFVVSGTT